MIMINENGQIQSQMDLFQLMLYQVDSPTTIQTPNKSTHCATNIGQEPFGQVSTPIDTKQQIYAQVSNKHGCNCTRSMCLKNYCPCHRDGNKCNSNCSCQGCKNIQFIPKRFQYTMGSIEHFSTLPLTF